MRNPNIAAAVGVAIIFVGSYLFRHAGEGPHQMVAAVAFISSFVVLRFLDEREKRRHDRSQ
jgi:hypothetical membrane protein